MLTEQEKKEWSELCQHGVDTSTIKPRQSAGIADPTTFDKDAWDSIRLRLVEICENDSVETRKATTALRRRTINDHVLVNQAIDDCLNTSWFVKWARENDPFAVIRKIAARYQRNRYNSQQKEARVFRNTEPRKHTHWYDGYEQYIKR